MSEMGLKPLKMIIVMYVCSAYGFLWPRVFQGAAETQEWIWGIRDVWQILNHVWSWAAQTEQTRAHEQENIFSRHHDESRHQGEIEIDCEPLTHKTAFRRWSWRDFHHRLLEPSAGFIITNAVLLLQIVIFLSVDDPVWIISLSDSEIVFALANKRNQVWEI